MAETEVPRLRTAVVSQRRNYDQVGFTGLYEFEDMIVSELTDGVLLEPSGNALSRPLHKADRVARSRLAQMGIGTGRKARDRSDDDYEFDVLFLAVRNAFEVDVLDEMAHWRNRARHTFCYVVELWPPHLRDWKLALQGFQLFDHVFVGLENGVKEFERIIGVPTTFVPPAVDALAFHPGNPAPERSIDVVHFGRASNVTHRSLMDFAARHNAYYQFGTIKDPRFVRSADHRQQHAALLQRSVFSIANYAKFNSPSETEGVREIGYRFFECAAAGTIMVGQGPKTETFHNLFGYPGDIIDIEIDARGIGELLAELRTQPELLATYRHASLDNALRRNDWAHRWRDMMFAAGLQADASTARLDSLAALADREHRPALGA